MAPRPFILLAKNTGSAASIFALSPFLTFSLSHLLLLLFVSCATPPPRPPHLAPTAPVTQPSESYLRVARPDHDTVAIEVAVRRFVPRRGSGPVVWLAGASHIGTTNYYAALQTHLDAQALVLYEGVGARSKSQFAEMRRTRDASGSSSLQTTMARSLGLEFQLLAVDYDRPHFRNSDLTIPQLQAFFTPTNIAAGKSTNDSTGLDVETLTAAMDGSSFLGQIMHGVMKIIGSSPKLRAITRAAMIEIMGEFGDDPTKMRGMAPDMKRLLTVLLHERNKVVVTDLRAVLRQRKPPASVSIFYGAAHMTDLEKRLRDELGYAPDGQLWLPAFGVNSRESGVTDAELNLVRGMIRWQLDQLK